MRKRLLIFAAILLIAMVPRADRAMSMGDPPAAIAIWEPALAPGSRIVVDTDAVSLFDRGNYFIGASTHFATSRPFGYDPAKGPAGLDRINANSFREDIFWQVPRSGKAGDPLVNARLAAMLRAERYHPLLILNGGSTIIKDGLPITPARRHAFADFAARAVAETKHRSPTYEIWNEWNHPTKTEAVAFPDHGFESDPRYSGNYAALASAAIPAIRAVDPDARILVGAAAADWSWNWLAGVVRSGGLRGADGLSVHLYNQCHAKIRGAQELISRLRLLQRRVRPYNGDRDVDVYVTEWGWSTGETCRLTDDFIIANSAQFLFAAAATPWIRGTWQYELKDSGRNRSSQMDTFGVLDFEWHDKPTTCASREAAAVLRSVRSIGSAADRGGVRLIVARTAGEYIAIAWDGHNSGAVVAVEGSGRFTAKPICGNERQVTGGQVVALSPVPVVIRLGKEARDLSIAAR